jgi:hypothetical protein
VSKSDLKCVLNAFRGPGLVDVTKYDEFLRMCLLMKDRPEAH